MLIDITRTGLPLRRTRTFRLGTLAAAALVVFASVELSADRRRSGGSVRQTRNVNRNVGANRANNYNRNVNRNVNVNRNTNVNVNRNVNTGYGYRRGAVAVGEEGAVAVGRRGAVVAGEEGFVGVGRHGAVVGGERYESYEGWRVAAGVATGIAVGTMLARPPTASVTVVAGGTSYMYADGAYYEQVYYGGQTSYRVVTAPAGAIITTLPGGCTTTIMGNVSVQQCGSTYYRRVSTGYQVVVF
jgi:Family of unknown function (DUF6515)